MPELPATWISEEGLPELLVTHQSSIANSAWLQDDVVEFAMMLLRRQYSWLRGADTGRSWHASTQFEPAEPNTIQILYQGNYHWVMVSNVGGKLLYIDTLGWSLNDISKQNILKLFGAGADEIELTCVNVYKQPGGWECGYMALAFAEMICRVPPADIVEKLHGVHFEVKALSSWLMQCIAGRCMKPMPVAAPPRSAKRVYNTAGDVYTIQKLTR